MTQCTSCHGRCIEDAHQLGDGYGGPCRRCNGSGVEPAPVAPKELAPCNSIVFSKGTVIALLDIKKEVAEDMCRKCTEQSGHLCDWHYSMGRVVVKSLAPAECLPAVAHFWNVVRINLNPGGILYVRPS